MKIQFTDKTISGDENQEDYFFLDYRKAKPIPIAYYQNRSIYRTKMEKKKDITIYNVYWKLE
jgi:hypothetical protein